MSKETENLDWYYMQNCSLVLHPQGAPFTLTTTQNSYTAMD